MAQKNAAALPPLSQTLRAPDWNNRHELELDELWSFVRKKSCQSWIWIALCRRTRQVLAYYVGDRSRASCRRLWARLPPGYRAAHCFTDFWEAYQKVIRERATHRVWERARSDGTRRALEQHAATKAGALCQKDVIFLEGGADAQDLFATFYPPLQALAASNLTSPLPPTTSAAK